MVQMQQDSSDPTGVKDLSPRGSSMVSRARNRKANAAIELKLSGATWVQIAETVGYPTPRAAMVAVERALEKQLANREDRNALRDLAGRRLDRLLLSLWAKANNPKDPEHLQANAKAREVIGDMRRLYGLDAPAEYIVTSPQTQEIEQWVARFLALQTPDVVEYDIVDGDWEETDAISS